MAEHATVDAYGVLTEPATVTMKRLLPGPIERVWAYLTQSELRRQWLAAGEMDMKVGAPFELAWRSDELTNPPGRRPAGISDRRMQSRIVALDPPRRLVIAWDNSGDVSFDLEPRGSEVLLTLVHRRLPNRASLLGHTAGWHTHLDLLVARASGTEPEPFWDRFSRLREEYDRRIPPADEQTPTISTHDELQMDPESSGQGTDHPGSDDVETSVFAPPRVAPRTAFAVQAHLHLRSDTSRVFRRAQELDKTANRLAFRSLTKRIARGATVELCLDCPSLAIDEPYKTVTWNGVPERVAFQVEEVGNGSSRIEAMLYVSVDGIPVGDIAFTLQVAGTGQEAAARASAQATRYEQAFISYSRRDFDKVSLFAQGLAASNIKPCVDVTHLEPGQEWEHKLPHHIGGSDVFYLMWSDHAAASPWVERESREAVKLYETSDPKRPRIVPITLHRPAPEPPAYLRHFHFDSPWLAQRAAQSVPLFRAGTGGG